MFDSLSPSPSESCHSFISVSCSCFLVDSRSAAVPPRNASSMSGAGCCCVWRSGRCSQDEEGWLLLSEGR
eukprot:7144740-Prymnesium_polylepis.2